MLSFSIERLHVRPVTSVLSDFCGPVDCSPPGSSVHGILQARILKSVAIPSSTEQSFQFSPVQFSRSVVSDSLWPHGLRHARLPCPPPTPGAYSNSCPSSWWSHPTIPSSVVPFSSCLQSFPTSGSFPMSQFFASGGRGIAVSASASILLMNIQDWFPLRSTGLISLQSKGLSRVFSNTTVQKHQFFEHQFNSMSLFYSNIYKCKKELNMWFKFWGSLLKCTPQEQTSLYFIIATLRLSMNICP